MILCDRNPEFDGFNPLQGACNLRSVFGAFEHADVSVACRKQLFGECVCVLSTEPFLIPSVYMEQLSCCSLAFDSWSSELEVSRFCLRRSSLESAE